MFVHWEVRSWVAGELDQWWHFRGLTRMRALRKAQRVAREIESEYLSAGASDYEISIFDRRTGRLFSMTTADVEIAHPNTPYQQIVKR